MRVNCLTRITINGKELDVSDYEERTEIEDDKPVQVRTFELITNTVAERKTALDILKPEKMLLSVEGSKSTEVMKGQWSYSYSDRTPVTTFRIELRPYRKTYKIEDFTLGPIIALLKVTEATIKILTDKGILTNDDVEKVGVELFRDKERRKKILDYYYGPEVADYIMSLAEKEKL